MRAAARITIVAAVVAAGAAVAMVVGAATPVGAAGTGGVELTPVAPTDGTAFHVVASAGHPGVLAFELRNISGAPAEAHLYPAAVSRTGTAYSVSSSGTASWIALPDQIVHLDAGESRHFEASVDSAAAPPGQVVYGAVVQENLGDVAVRRRVATLVYLTRHERGGPPTPLAWLVLATMLLGAAALAVVLQAARQGDNR